MSDPQRQSRRQFLHSTTLAASAALLPSSLVAAAKREQSDPLYGAMGLVTASLSAHIATKPGGKDKFTLLELPKIMADELGLKVIDFNTMNFHTFDPGYLEKLRLAAEQAGCLMTNLKMNQKVDMNSKDPSIRTEAMKVYKESIDAAALLGLQWVRPLPRSETPDRIRHVDAYRELIDYAGEKGIVVLVENFGWMMSDPDSVVKLIREIDNKGVAVGVDTGNWTTNEIRYPALEKSFPLAVTCDFKAKTMGPKGEHKLYDLKRCFEIGWQAGFRGPWCFEHGHKDRAQAFKELVLLRDWMKEWMAEAEQK